MSAETIPWDVQDHLQTPEARSLYFQAMLDDDATPAELAAALGDIAQAAGWSAVAREAQVGRSTLHKAFGPEGNPRLDTLMAALKAMGLRLSVTPVEGKAA